MTAGYQSTENDSLVTAPDVETPVESLFDDSRDMTMTISSPKKKFALLLTLVLVLVVGVTAKMYGTATAAKSSSDDMVDILPSIEEMLVPPVPDGLPPNLCGSIQHCQRQDGEQCCFDPDGNIGYPVCMNPPTKTAYCFF